MTLIGATTENPYFEVNSALLSRSQIYELRDARAGADPGAARARAGRPRARDRRAAAGRRRGARAARGALRRRCAHRVRRARARGRGRARGRRPDRPGDRRGRAAAQGGDLRQAGRPPLRLRLGADQGDARVRPGRGDLLPRGDARGRRGPALHRPPDGHPRLRGHRQRRPAGAARRDRRRPGGRPGRAARMRAQPRPGGGLPRPGAEVERLDDRDLGARCATSASTAPSCRPTTCATPTTPARGSSVAARATSIRTTSPAASPSSRCCPRRLRGERFYEPTERGFEAELARAAAARAREAQPGPVVISRRHSRGANRKGVRMLGSGRWTITVVLAVAVVALAAPSAPAIVPPKDCGNDEGRGQALQRQGRSDPLQEGAQGDTQATSPGMTARADTTARTTAARPGSNSVARTASRSSSRSAASARLSVGRRRPRLSRCGGRRLARRHLAGERRRARLVQRANLPIPEWLFAWAAALVLIVSFVALAAALAASRASSMPAGARCPARSAGGSARPRWRRSAARSGSALLALVVGLRARRGPGAVRATSRRRSSSSPSGSGWRSRAPCSATSSRAFSPWRALGRATGWALGRRRTARPYPERLGRWPAAAGLFAFAWIELASGWSEEPRTLAIAVLGYTALTLAAQARLRGRGLEPAGRGVRRLLRPLRADLAVRAPRRRRRRAPAARPACRGSTRSPGRSRSSP